MFTWPSLSKKDIPHQTKIHQEILIQAHAAEVKVHEALAKIEGKVSFTFDTGPLMHMIHISPLQVTISLHLRVDPGVEAQV